MSGTTIGIIESCKFRRLWPKPASMEDVARLTSIKPMQAIPPENGELDLTAHEGKIIAVRGDDQGDWVYSAEVIDTGGKIAKTLATKVFTKPTEADIPLPEKSHLTLNLNQANKVRLRAEIGSDRCNRLANRDVCLL